MRQIESLWRRWQRGETLETGWVPWRDIFSLLKDLRTWGPQDRVDPVDALILVQEIHEHADEELIRLEIELVFRKKDQHAAQAEQALIAEVQRKQGLIISRSRIKEIAYHAMLVELPVTAVREIIALAGLAGIDPVMYIRPQGVASTVEVADSDRDESPIETGPLGEPILALLDGMPLARHRLLERHLVVDDVFGLEPAALVAERKHGTAMASLIVHGDRNRKEPALLRKIHVVPVLAGKAGAAEEFPSDRLIVDVMYTAVRAMREGVDAAAPGVLIVNISLGNPRQVFHRRLSALAKLLDRLAYQYGILFVISAGNVTDRFAVPGFAKATDFEDAKASEDGKVNPSSVGVLGALGAVMGERKIISPAESVNGITVGGWNSDAVPPRERQAAQNLIDPYPEISISNPSSRLGPGYLLAVKPDILMPGARERLRVVTNSRSHIEVVPVGPQRPAGIKVAAPPRGGQEDSEGYTNGTSAAAALASRTCHRIHDALEAAYGDAVLSLPHRERAVLLKALLAHTARWPSDAVTFIKKTLGPTDNKQHVRQKDNIRRFLGYGIVDANTAIACAADRATFWAVGEARVNEVIRVPIPIPIPHAINGKAQPHAIAVTVAWFTPTHAGTKAYRSVRLKLLKPDELGALGLEAYSDQPDLNQSNRGTLFSQRWEGRRAPAVSNDMVLRLHIQREPDQAGIRIDEPIPFGLAVTLEMPGVIEIYEEVRQRLAVQAQVRVG